MHTKGSGVSRVASMSDTGGLHAGGSGVGKVLVHAFSMGDFPCFRKKSEKNLTFG